MIKLDITTRNFEASDKIRSYVSSKITALEKYLPRKHRAEVKIQVMLEEDENGREDNRFVCEVIMLVPGAKFISREGTVNMYAAVDIVEAKLKAQIRTHKDKTTAKPRASKGLSRLWSRRSDAETTTIEPSL